MQLLLYYAELKDSRPILFRTRRIEVVKCVSIPALIVSSLVVSSGMFSCEQKIPVEQVKRGNFLLPSSQQPSVLFSLGQNIVDKGDILGFSFLNALYAPPSYGISLNYAALYGITDRCSILVGVPILFLKTDKGKRKGFSDFFAIAEYAFYQKIQPEYTHQATILGGITTPNGSTVKQPTLGGGGPSYLVGLTVSSYSPEWLYFVSMGGTMCTKGRGVRLGSNFLYEGGFGKNIGTRPGWIFAFLVEFNGIYTKTRIVDNAVDQNSGSNLFFITPSFWISSKNVIIQAGVSFVPMQHFFGCQDKVEVGGLFSIAWKFNA